MYFLAESTFLLSEHIKSTLRNFQEHNKSLLSIVTMSYNKALDLIPSKRCSVSFDICHPISRLQPPVTTFWSLLCDVNMFKIPRIRETMRICFSMPGLFHLTQSSWLLRAVTNGRISFFLNTVNSI